jgi:UDP-GlcNAc3NAcA epimerase
MKILTVLGARPQFIKASAVSRRLREVDQVSEVVVHTGQHFDENMSAVFFRELGMEEPKYNLDIHGGNHGEMTGRMLIEVEKVILAERPSALLVYGDTNSTLAGSLAASKLHVPVAHVEAGLRSFNQQMPEEINRIVTDSLARWLFAPTRISVENLRREGVSSDRIFLVGDVMYDAALMHGSRASSQDLEKLTGHSGDKPFVLVTIHRAENTDSAERLQIIVEALSSLSREINIVWPVHPRTKRFLRDAPQLRELVDSLRIIDPVGYIDMVALQKNATIVVTDSGGVQKEAFFHRVPCVTLRDETEWVELVEAGWNRVVPPRNAGRIVSEVRLAIGTTGVDIEPYGKGDASERIVTALTSAIGV